MTIDHHKTGQLESWMETEFDIDELNLPAQPQFHRCGAVHCIDNGPWLGTLVCCIRHSDHDGDHSMSLGDQGSDDFWQESWL